MKSFADEAIKQCMRTTDVYSEAAPISGYAMQKGVQWLKSARRYRIELPLIPRGDEERKIAMLSEYAHAMTMPEKFMLIEYEAGGVYDTKPDLTRALATRRIALVVDLESEYAVSVAGIKDFHRQETDQGAIMVWPLTYFDEKRDWEFAAAAAIIPKYQAIQYLAEYDRPLSVSEKLRTFFTATLPAPEDAPMHVYFQEMLPEIAKQLGEEHKRHVFIESSLDAVWAALGMLSALLCRNNKIDDVGAVLHEPEMTKDGRKLPVCPLDPYRGRAERTKNGGYIWRQETTAPIK